MPDFLKIINEVIAQHQSIRQQINGVEGAANDLETLFAVQKARTSLAQSSIATFGERKKQLEEVLASFGKGLGKHFSFEEKTLPSLLGAILMKALVFEHRRITGAIEKARDMASGITPEGLAQEMLLTRKAWLQQEAARLVRQVEEHASQEETVLRMIKSSLEVEG